MAFAYGQNVTELGRNIIDLEQLKNARDAQQAQAQNQFLAQLNQARLGQQQIAAQSQAQQNALMMQALQQRQQQGNLDRDFGLRQTAQGNQAQQFADQLALERRRLEINPYSASTQNTIARANEERMYQNQLAKGKASEAQARWVKLLKDYEDEKVAITKDTPEWYLPGFIDNMNIRSKLVLAEKAHKKAKDDLVAGLGEFRGVLNIVEDPTDPYKTRFEPIILPPIDISGIGNQGNTFQAPIPVSRPVETGVGPLPINLPRVQPGRSSTPVPFPATANIVPQVVSQAQSQSPIPSYGMSNPVGAAVSAIRQNVLPPIFQAMGRQVYGTGQPAFEWYNPFKNYGNGITNAPANSYFDPIPTY